MAVILTTEQLKLFFIGKQKHRAYLETVDLMTKIKTHADGIVPETLIGKRRPSESETTMAYRKDIYVPKTKNPIGKVISSLTKIRRSPDWAITYDEAAVPATIVEGERLQDYCEKNYPGCSSVTNWVFSVLLKNQCVDANAIIAVVPMNLEAANQNEYYTPLAMVFNSDQVYFYEEGSEYAILQSNERSSLTPYDPQKQLSPGTVYYVITTTEYMKWEQTPLGDYERTQYLFHGKNELPVFKIRAQFLKQKENTVIQESRISGMVPSLDEAAREYSDLQAAKVQHMYPLFWYIQSKECKACSGTGKVTGAKGITDCQQCYDENLKTSTGRIKFSPYAHLQVDPPSIGDKSVPTPPAGYVSRDVDIIKHQEESVKSHLFDALASINMQFLDQTPLNISGDAKNVDREELNNFVYSFAEDLVATMDRCYYWINEWRYATIVPDKDKRMLMLPKITVPQNFDLLPSDYLIDEITKGKNAKANAFIVQTMEREYAVKKFYNNPELVDYINLYYDLDPLPGLEVADKESLYMNKAITQMDLVVSTYLPHFIKRALIENKDFGDMDFEKQVEIIEGYGQEKIDANDAAAQVKAKLLADQMAAAGMPAGGKPQPGAQPAPVPQPAA
jgi:hypothetical protein